MVYELDAVRVLVLSIFVLWLGEAITSRVPLLQRFSIPVAVTGGLVCSAIVAGLGAFADVRVGFDLAIRDELLLVFFSTVGLSAKLAMLRKGGVLLARLGLLTVLFLAAQNALGVGLATLLGNAPGYGLIAGSVSLAGGHGTAITWGAIADEAGLAGATTLGLTFATFGLICGGLVGGPVAVALIRRHGLAPPGAGEAPEAGSADNPADEGGVRVTTHQAIRTILLLGICLAAGSELNRWLGAEGIVLPGFLTAMGVGIVLTNLSDLAGRPVHEDTTSLFGDVSLHLFLAMSLMSMQLGQLAGSLGPVTLALALQVALAVAFATTLVFRVCGRDYDAAVMAAGYAGLGLGATPVGVANMNAVTSRFGPSAQAFLVVPLVGAFLLDIVNAFVIQLYIQLLGRGV